MKLKINANIIEKFQGVVIGVVVCKNLDNTGACEQIQDELRNEENRIRTTFETPTLSQHPKIDIWRKAYAAFGAKPKENKSSVENLYRMVLQGTNLRHINKLVDIYNFICLKYMLPVGGEDRDKIEGDVFLTFAEQNEPAVALLGEKEARSPHAGEVIYKDNISAICRRWNWREAERTKLTEQTKDCFLVIEALPPVTKQEVEQATKELKELVEKYCGGTITHTILDESQREVDI